MQFLIKPKFDDITNALFFPTDKMNFLLEGEYNDNFGFYQQTFGVYSYMTLTTDMTYRMHYPEGTPFMWQVHNNCSWTPTGTLSMAEDEITPCKAKINEQMCYDEYMDSAFKAFLQWGNRPNVDLSPAGQQATDSLIRTVAANATLGHRMTLVGGQVMDLSAVEFKTGTKTRIEQAYRNTADTCKGWVELARTLAAADATN